MHFLLMHKPCKEEESCTSNENYEECVGVNLKAFQSCHHFSPCLCCSFSGFIQCKAQKRGKFIRKLRPVEYCIAFTKLYHAFDYCHLHRKITDHASLLQ